VPGLRYGRHRACSGDPSVITLGLAVVLVSGPWIPFWSCSVSRARCSPCAARLTLSSRVSPEPSVAWWATRVVSCESDETGSDAKPPHRAERDRAAAGRLEQRRRGLRGSLFEFAGELVACGLGTGSAWAGATERQSSGYVRQRERDLRECSAMTPELGRPTTATDRRQVVLRSRRSPGGHL
jgi:hypothetical protein